MLHFEHVSKLTEKNLGIHSNKSATVKPELSTLRENDEHDPDFYEFTKYKWFMNFVIFLTIYVKNFPQKLRLKNES